MATVPELKAQAKALGIKGYSSMLKAELESAVTAAKLEAIQEAPIKPESVTREVSMLGEVDPKAVRREAARQAGSRAKVTAPLSESERTERYVAQNTRQGASLAQYGNRPKKVMTFAQCRRSRKKGNRALKVA